jgi:hypothetical protein
MSGDPSCITSKAPPGAKSDKKRIGIAVLIGNRKDWMGQFIPAFVERFGAEPEQGLIFL